MNAYYEIEIVNWQWQATKTKNDRFYFAKNSHPRIKRFRTQKAARVWLEDQGFTPYFKDASRPSVYYSDQGGMQATIREADSSLWVSDSIEMSIAREVANV